MLGYSAAPGPACAADTTQPGTVSKQEAVHEAVELLITSTHAKKKSLPSPVPYITHPSLVFLLLMYSSLALAGACSAKRSELQMDAALTDREDFDSCNLERETSKPTVF